MYIQDPVAVVGGDPFTPDRLPTQAYERSGNEAPRHWDDLYGQRVLPEGFDNFRLIDDTDEFVCRACHNLLAGQRSTAPFDELLGSVHLVSTVDVDIDARCSVQVENVNAMGT